MQIDMIRLAVVAGLAVVCFGTGWQTRGWKEDSEDLAVQTAAQKIVDLAIERESGIAGKVEERLAELSANQTVIDRGIIRETEKPIYLRVCLDTRAISLLNAVATGQASPDTAKPAAEVPGTAGAAD